MDEATFIQRIRTELAAEFSTAAHIELSRNGRLLVAQQVRSDANVQVFSFDEFDAHFPFTLRISLAALLHTDRTRLVSDLAQPGRRFASEILLKVRDHAPSTGLNLAIATADGAMT